MNEEAVEDDGLDMWEIKQHTFEKLNGIREETKLFSNMKSKFPQLVFIDLFASSGYLRDKATKKVYKGSAMIGLEYTPPFTHFIFCESNPQYMEALNQRVKREYSQLISENRVSFIPGDANCNVGQVISHLPNYSATNRRLCLCVVDPFRLQDLRYKTFQKLGEFAIIDFMVSVMTSDIQRHWKQFLSPSSNALDQVFGYSGWRLEYSRKPAHETNVQFFWRILCSQMEALGYRPSEDEHLVRNAINNSPLYRVVVFSKNPLGRKFGKVATQRSESQIKLDF
jgi:three-Cys-motif partner protein